VREGQLLARLDSRRLESQKTVLSAKWALAEAGVKEAQANWVLAKAVAQRHGQLAKLGQVSRQSLEEVQSQYQAAAARKAAQRASLAQVKAELQALHVSLALSEIRAPYAGRILKRSADEGTSLAIGKPVLTLIETDAMEAHVGIPPESLSALKPGATYELLIAGQPFTARLRELLPEVDGRSRTVRAVFNLHEDERRFIDGQLVQLSLMRQVDEAGFWLPLSALTEGRRGLWTAYAIKQQRDGARLERRALQLLHVEAERVFVKGTLSDGDRLVRSGLHRLTPGQRVVAAGGAK
jgi:RND family efflux transporter MFP subunit